MSRTPNTPNPPKYRPSWIGQAEALLAQIDTPTDAALLRNLAADHLCAIEIAADPTVTVGKAVSDADLQCRLATGHGLRGPTDYKAYKAPNAPSVGTIYRAYGPSFTDTLQRFGITGAPRTTASILADFNPRRRNGKEHYTEDECARALARAIEDQVGFPPSVRVYDRWREAQPGAVPKYEQIKNVFGSWNAAVLTAIEHALRNPESHPLTARRDQLVKATNGETV